MIEFIRGRLNRSTDYPGAGGTEDLIESGGEAGVPVVQDELHPRPGILQVHEQVPGLLDHPGLDRVLGGSEDAYPARAVLYNGEDVDLRSVEQVGGEEVQRQDPCAWDRRNTAQPGPSRRGAGSMPAFLRICQTVDGATVMPSPASSPWMRRYPHDSFSRASRSTTDPTLRCVAGRPDRPWHDRRDHRRRTMSRRHRKMVPGVTISRVAARRSIGSVPASRASNARSGHVKRE
jgi:hypothetical protein